MSGPGRSPRPPLLFFGCLLTGWGLGFLHPLALGLPALLERGLGVALFLVAGLFGGGGLLAFRRGGTSPEPNGLASVLLTTGPFRLSRNPLYLALALLLAAFGFLLDSAWMLGLTLVLVLLLDRLVIVREEARLRHQFGEGYRAYSRRVRRWF